MICKLVKVNISEKEILHRLLQYSLFEESETDLNEMDDTAVFEYKYFDSYFTDATREAYFVKSAENKLLGFAMINTYMKKSPKGHSIAEFMIIPKYRRKKIGKQAAFEIFNSHKGFWEISPSLGSEKAYLFWKNVIGNYTSYNYRYEDGIFIFNLGE
ncbi:MAG: GNAT family N-acetyltransferase [Oscillospiraceae bacterium]|nr:GNAT family N-acetyltransferase [Oscillospiraceae bacterium]